MGTPLRTRKIDRLVNAAAPPADAELRRRYQVTLAVGLLLLGGLVAEARPRQDLYGDPLPRDAIARMGSIRWRHADQIGAHVDVVPSPTGQLVATANRADSAKAVRVWDLSDGRPVCELPPGDTV